MNYRALLVDVDGTLMSHDCKTIAPAVAQGLADLQARGIPVIVATGRGAFAVRPAVMGGVCPDYIICANGAYLAEDGGRVLWEQPLTAAQFEAICDLGRTGACIGFSFDDGYYCYYGEETFRGFFRRLSGDMEAIRPTGDRMRHLRGYPHAGFGLMDRAVAERWSATRDDMRMTGYSDTAFDINRVDCNKATGADRLLSMLGLGWSETVFIGDGENDVELLSAAGLGVAMGNARDTVKAAADMVTGSVREHGVLQAIKQIF